MGPVPRSVTLDDVHDFWNDASCGERLYLAGTTRAEYAQQAEQRYALEPYIETLAGFDAARGQRVLEIGVGLGADHQRFAEAGAVLSGIDLTERAVEHTRQRLHAFGLAADVSVGNAEHLGFSDRTFDVVYSWGVLHHTPDTPAAILEVHRVLREGGTARIMIYHSSSLVGAMLWLRYALLRGRPWLPLQHIYSRYLESPGTKAYSRAEARTLFARFREVNIRTVLTHGDLLTSGAGQGHEGAALSFARRVWPRPLFRRYCQRLGLFMLIEARK